MKKKNLLILLVCLLPIISFSQVQGTDIALEKYLRKSEGYYKNPNVIKINALAIALSNISISYERAVAPRLSILFYGGYKYSGDNPKIFSLSGTTIEAQINKISGYSFAPELRYYMKTCESRFLEGFYLGLYGKYTYYATDAQFDYYPEDLPEEFYMADMNLTEVGVGIQLGYQLVLWERFTIDFLFFGPRYSRLNLIYEFDKNVSQQFLDELSYELNEIIDRFGLDYTVELKQTGETRTSTSFSFANMRFGIGLGFAF